MKYYYSYLTITCNEYMAYLDVLLAYQITE